MAYSLDEGFADIIAMARSRLVDTHIEHDIDGDRAILTVDGRFRQHRIVIKETVSFNMRRYAYYVLMGDRVIWGFDNHPDRTALRLRYGDNFLAHIHELIPHQHGLDKQNVSLTEPWTANQFLNELDNLVPSAATEAN